MYSAAVYNYFNNGRQARKLKCRRKKIPIPKPSQKKQINKCKLCGRRFVRMQNKDEKDTGIDKQPGNVVFEKALLIWKYAKNLLTNTVPGNGPQKCSFKIIAHKSYKKRSLHQEIISTTSIISQICKICEKRRIQVNKCKELEAEENRINEHVINDLKCKAKKNGKKKIKKPRKPRLVQNKNQPKKLDNKKCPTNKIPISNEFNKNLEHNQWDECLGEMKQNIKLCSKSNRSSVKIKKQKRNCTGNATKTAIKKVASKKKIEMKKQKPKKICLPRKKCTTNKKKRMFSKENKKKVNRFASWQYMQHALSSVDEETITNYVNEDSTPVYLTFEEYCLILDAIDTQGSTAEKFRDITEEIGKNIAEITGSFGMRRLNVTTEDVSTNTDQPIENTEDASTNTELFRDTTEEVATNTEAISNEQTNEITEEFDGTIEDINTEQLSETTETLAAINDPLSEIFEEFDENIHEPGFETNEEESSKEIEILDQNSSKDFDIIPDEENNCNIVKNNTMYKSEENISTNLVSQGIEQMKESNGNGNQSKKLTQPPEETLDNILNSQDETDENTCSDNQVEDGDDFFEN